MLGLMPHHLCGLFRVALTAESISGSCTDCLSASESALPALVNPVFKTGALGAVVISVDTPATASA